MTEARAEFDPSRCSIAKALDIVGQKWCLLILREAFYGASRFSEFAEILKCPRVVLSARLDLLVGEGLLRTRPYRDEGQRQRTEYLLTRKGAELFPALIALMHWGDRWLPDPDGPAVEIAHGCGTPVRLQMECEAGHHDLSVHDLKPRLPAST